VRLYEEMSNRLRVVVTEKSLTLTEALDLLSHPDSTLREATAKALSVVFTQEADAFAFIFSTIMKDKAIDDKWRGFVRPVSARNLSNLVEDAIVDTLTESVTAQYEQLNSRYYRLKAKLFGKTQLNYWDRNAPLPDDQDKPIAWDEAKGIVLGAYRQFSPAMADIAEMFFTRNWIDAPLMQGKTSGAFSHPTVPSAHPYIHQVLSAEQGALMADTPLTLAETASVFGEQLTFQYLLSHEEEKGARIRLIAGKVEDMLNTVVRQIAFYQFETAVHNARRQGEISAEEIAGYWMQTQAESFGDAIMLDDSYRHYWTYISHFYHTPFYVYAYAFGDCLVNSLYAMYAEEKTAGRGAAFEERYITMLRSGGTLRHKELLSPFGIDIAGANFWNKGLAHIATLIDALEKELA
jgi:oligoendopeptidase F